MSLSINKISANQKEIVKISYQTKVKFWVIVPIFRKEKRCLNFNMKNQHWLVLKRLVHFGFCDKAKFGSAANCTIQKAIFLLHHKSILTCSKKYNLF